MALHIHGTYFRSAEFSHPKLIEGQRTCLGACITGWTCVDGYREYTLAYETNPYTVAFRTARRVRSRGFPYRTVWVGRSVAFCNRFRRTPNL